jgi:hypothetical protein
MEAIDEVERKVKQLKPDVLVGIWPYSPDFI